MSSKKKRTHKKKPLPSEQDLALQEAQRTVDQILEGPQVVIFSKTFCPFCQRARNYFTERQIVPMVVDLDTMSDGAHIQAHLHQRTGQRTVPSIFFQGQHLGGFSTLPRWEAKGTFEACVRAECTPSSDVNNSLCMPDQEGQGIACQCPGGGYNIPEAEVQALDKAYSQRAPLYQPDTKPKNPLYHCGI
eukprot:NODE_2282_length_728_cov_60.846834_g1845_i0.p2 GENE.NODE_2282_length_728_cov_60.846834_g1845_i0~~NODE_2282_length_728_cov_60.846834_g1845_i0.p2  ORF type:complete len:189 (+),score=33.75 NODE_2282_length_728_cov_60.846834_g1845_i0:105-671(+)